MVKVVVIHIRPRFLARDISDVALGGLLDVPDGLWSAVHQNEKQTALNFMRRQELFGCQVFPLAAIAIDHGHAVGLRPAAQPAAEASGHAHQMLVVELVIGPEQRAPPVPETSAIAAAGQVGVYDDAINAALDPCDKFLILTGELVWHASASEPAYRNTRLRNKREKPHPCCAQRHFF